MHGYIHRLLETKAPFKTLTCVWPSKRREKDRSEKITHDGTIIVFLRVPYCTIPSSATLLYLAIGTISWYVSANVSDEERGKDGYGKALLSPDVHLESQFVSKVQRGCKVGSTSK